MPNSFKLSMQDDDEWFFYTDQAVSFPLLTLATLADLLGLDRTTRSCL